jgi:hypothetical protein
VRRAGAALNFPIAPDTSSDVISATRKDALVPTPHPPGFRQRAVALARQSTRPVPELAKDLGISESHLRNWMIQADADEALEGEDIATRNRWSVYPDDVIGWRSVLPELADDQLGRWSRSVLDAGVETGMLTSITPIPVGPLPLAGVLQTTTRVAYVNGDGDVVEGDVADMADLVAEVGTTAASLHVPALTVMTLREGGGGVSTTISFATDIWLPWTSVAHEPGMQWDELVDNFELAAVHAPRLNAFLAAVREATEEVGGQWSLDEDVIFSLYSFEVDETGVLLNVPLSEHD